MTRSFAHPVYAFVSSIRLNLSTTSALNHNFESCPSNLHAPKHNNTPRLGRILRRCVAHLMVWVLECLERDVGWVGAGCAGQE